jgi:gas vesicle protein
MARDAPNFRNRAQGVESAKLGWRKLSFAKGEAMSDTRAGDRAVFFLLGAVIGAAAALLMAPASGAHTRRRLRRQGEEVADYLIDAGKELVDKCEDLYERSGEVVEDATHELSGKYRALREHSKQLLDEAETILRRTKSAAIDR